MIYLEIRDKETNGKTYFYKNRFSLEDKSNLLSISLPKDAPSLLTGTTYQWKFEANENGKLVGETVGYIN